MKPFFISVKFLNYRVHVFPQRNEILAVYKALFLGESIAKGVIDGCVCLLVQALTANYRKNLLIFQIFNYSCFSTAAKK